MFTEQQLKKYRKCIKAIIQHSIHHNLSHCIYHMPFRKAAIKFKQKDLDLLCKDFLNDGYMIEYFDWLEIGQEFLQISWDKKYNYSVVLGDKPQHI